MNTYVEISERQSGKTARLVKAALEHVLAGGIAVINAPSSQMRKLIIDRIQAESSKPLAVYGGIGASYVQLPSIHQGPSRAFFDEFDFYDAPYVEGAYYCTTVSKIRVPQVYIDAVKYRNPSHDLLAFLTVMHDVKRYTAEEKLKIDISLGDKRVTRSINAHLSEELIRVAVSNCVSELLAPKGVTLETMNSQGAICACLEANATCSSRIILDCSLVYKKIVDVFGDTKFYIAKDRCNSSEVVVNYDGLEARKQVYRNVK